MNKYLGLLLVGLLNFGCKTDPKKVGNSNEVQIGPQVWMTHNLNRRNFTNGDSIRLCRSHKDWIEAHQNQEPAMVYYNFDEAFAQRHGAIYNEWVIKDSRSIAPSGWHVPKQEDVQLLFEAHPLQPLYLSVKGNQPEDSGPWPYISYGFKEQQDSLGFHAYPAGEVPAYLEPLEQINFNGLNQLIAWWTQTEEGPSGALRFWNIYQVNHGVFHGGLAGARIGGAAGHYIRLIKN
jgi:uncharacterized protein (TIGR02145 family)